jgi:hypothetical protein
MLHIGEESFVKIQDLVVNLKFDIHVYMINGSCVLIVNYFHHKNISL